MSEWFENESFWKAMYPFLFPEEKFQSAAGEIEKILTLIDFKGSNVLDLCCGPGRHSIALAKKGLSVTAVDRSRHLVEKAKAAARAENLELEWVLEDMRKFRRPSAFDLVLNLFTSFGYFEDEKENLDVLALIYQNLKEGGIAFMDLIGKEIVAKIFQTTSNTNSIDLPDGTIIIQRHKVYDDWSRILNDWIVVKDGKAETYSFSHTIYSGKELKDLFLAAGFKEIRLYGNLDGGEYGPDAKRLIAAAFK